MNQTMDEVIREMYQNAQSATALAKQSAKLNFFEQELAKCPAAPTPPLVHRFTPGLYSREIFLQKNLQCTSKIHKTEHQFIVIGVFEMWSEESGWIFIDASKKPFHGTTKPGARRAFRIHEDTWFTTFHPTTLTDLAQIEAALIEPHDIPQRTEELR
jgi:hypothetical protein